MSKGMEHVITKRLESWEDDGKDHLPLGWNHRASAAALADVTKFQAANREAARARIPVVEENPDDTAVHIVNVGPWDFHQHVGSWGSYHIPAFGSVKVPGFLWEPSGPQEDPLAQRIDGLQIAGEVMGSGGNGIGRYGVFICEKRGPNPEPTKGESSEARAELLKNCAYLISEASKEILDLRPIQFDSQHHRAIEFIASQLKSGHLYPALQ